MVHQVAEEQNNQNNETFDFVLKYIFVENIVHISVDIVDLNWHWLSILLILESFFILSLLYGFIDMANIFSPNFIGLSSAFFYTFKIGSCSLLLDQELLLLSILICNLQLNL